MCGIIGVFNNNHGERIVKKGLSTMKNRGKDGSNFINFQNNCIGHNLHAIVDLIKQPIKHEDNFLIANCEIYNWKKLNLKYKFNAKNDAELIIKLLNKKGTNNIVKTLYELDGVYAFCYFNKKENKLIIARDIIGEKPIWYSHSDFFAFASEKKALTANKIFDVIELNPRKIISYCIDKNKIEFIGRNFFNIKPENKEKKDKIKKNIIKLIKESVKKRLTDKKIGVLFSGGIDSVFIAFILKKMNIDFTCYTSGINEKGMETPEDVIYAKKAANKMGLKIKVLKADLKKTEKIIKKIIPLIETTNVVKVGVALPFYIACEQAKKDGVKVMFSGLGSEEIFAGYERHMNCNNVNNECVSGLLKMYERDLYRDDVVTMANSIELRLPFLDLKLIEYALKIPVKYKINNKHKKIILRECAEDIGIPQEFTWRKKKAAQYGSKFDRAIEKLAKKNNFKFKADYLNSLSNEKNLNLGIMWSSGKDSCYATYLMQKHNYNIKCLLSVKSKNKYSFMFHTPNINLCELQAEAMELPILTIESNGEKEDELKDMKDLMDDAKKKYNIDGIVTGAIFSQYQRERIEKIADELGLKVFSPLWHKEQEKYMRELINAGFKIILSSVAADGLDEKWLGKIMKLNDVDKLCLLNKKIGINVAGEGGEFESLVLDCPLFKKEINVKKSKILVEGKYNSFFVVEKAELIDK
jgi:diphthine-ammonia ligase